MLSLRALVLVLSALTPVLALSACGGEDGTSRAPSASRTAALTPAPAARRAAASQTGALVWAVGDGDAGPDAGKLVEVIRRSRPDRFLYLGDVYERGTAADFARRYAPTYGRLARLTAPTPGNHEWPRANDGYRPYWKRVMGKRVPSYYALEAGGWEILSMNSQVSHGTGSAQMRWLRARLRRPGTCRLAFWHRPRFSAGRSHGDQPDVAPLWRALAGHARLILGAHDHDSQRFRRRDGITQFVAGAGGRSLYPLRRDRRLAFGDARRPAALRLSLRPGAARIAFVDSSGRVLDRSSVRCMPLGTRR